MDFVSAIPEYSYMTQIVFLLFESVQKPLDDKERFRVEVHFSPGASVQVTGDLVSLCFEQTRRAGKCPSLGNTCITLYSVIAIPLWPFVLAEHGVATYSLFIGSVSTSAVLFMTGATQVFRTPCCSPIDFWEIDEYSPSKYFPYFQSKYSRRFFVHCLSSECVANVYLLYCRLTSPVMACLFQPVMRISHRWSSMSSVLRLTWLTCRAVRRVATLLRSPIRATRMARTAKAFTFCQSSDAEVLPVQGRPPVGVAQLQINWPHPLPCFHGTHHLLFQRVLLKASCRALRLLAKPPQCVPVRAAQSRLKVGTSMSDPY